MERIEDRAYRKALEVMHKNVSTIGFTASPERTVNYYSVWARDHAICALASVLTDDETLIRTSMEGVKILLKSQIEHGQVPSYIEIENRKKVYGGLGAITSVDSNMWVVIAAAILHIRTKDRSLLSYANMQRYMRFFRLFKSFDSNDCGLIEVPKAGDWADVFNRTYHVLYDEILYYQALKALAYLFAQGAEIDKVPEEKKKLLRRVKWVRQRKVRVKKRINQVMWFTKENIPSIFEEYMIYDKIEEKDYPYYVSHIIPFKIHWQWQFDTFGNVLAILCDVADKKKTRIIIDHALEHHVNEPYPVKALDPPVFKNNLGWQSIYKYKEQPHTYHNGGIWSMIAGFWVNALSRNGKMMQAKKDLRRLAEMQKRHRWRFYEHVNGKTGKPLGRTYQAWSAAGYIMAYHSVQKKINLFGL